MGQQILSPIRRDFCGCGDLNKWVQQKWRSKALENGRTYRTAFGPQEILKHDKVILLKNGTRNGYDRDTREQFEAYLANGEVALIKKEGKVNTKRGTLQVKDLLFAGRPAEHTFGFFRNEFGNDETGGAIIELAYALTVHKSQGSDFDVVIVVLPSGRMAYRELIYTALTRSREKLVLLVQGRTVADLIAVSAAPLRPRLSDAIATFSELLFVMARIGHMRVTSYTGPKTGASSQQIGANYLYRVPKSRTSPSPNQPRMDAPDGSWKWPDFTFMDEADDPIVWEHLGAA